MAELNFTNRQVILNNKKILAALVEVYRQDPDAISISSSQIAAAIGKSHSIVSRERGGLKNLIRDVRADFTMQVKIAQRAELARYVQGGSRAISGKFCMELALLFVDYQELFVLDIVRDSFLNTRRFVLTLSPLIAPKALRQVGYEIYEMLEEWLSKEPEFTRATAFYCYSKNLKEILNRYRQVILEIPGAGS